MGKIKTHKATQKRFKLTANGKVKLSHQHRRHKLGKMTPKRKRILRKAGYVSDANTANIKKLIPYAK